MRNYPEWSISLWACQAIGAIAVALNAWWTAAEIGLRAGGLGARRAADRRRAAGAPAPRCRATRGCQAVLVARRAARRRGRRGFRGGGRRGPRRAARRGRRPGRPRHHPLHLGHHRQPEGGDGDPSQPRHQPDEHPAGRRRWRAWWPGLPAAARSRRAAAGRAADLPVLPYRRPHGPLRRRRDRREAGADVQVGAARGGAADRDPPAYQRRRRADRGAPAAGDRAQARAPT